MTGCRFGRVLAMAGMALLTASRQDAAETRRLTLTEAVHLAIGGNRALKIARLKVRENEQKKAGERAAYFPTISNQSNVLHISELQTIGIPAGAFGVAAGALVPARPVELPQGDKTLVSSGTMIAQPLTQLLRIRDANRIAAAEVAVSRDDLQRAENVVALQVHGLYYGILIAHLEKQAADQQTAYAEARLRESEEDVRNGAALRVATIDSRAGLLDSQQAALTAELQLTDLMTELNDLLGLPLDTNLDLDPAVPMASALQTYEDYVHTAWAANPEVLAAEDTVRKARAGVAAAKTAYIPDVTAYARHSYQNGVPLLVRNFGTFGINLNWDVFDFGKRRAAVHVREAQLAQAEENVHRVQEEAAVGVKRSYDKVARTRHLVEVATQILSLRQESERLAENQLTHGVILISERRHVAAARYKAKADLLRASLGYLLARAELEQAVGHTPGL